MSARAAKVAISVDGAVLAGAERLRRTTGESRSALVTRALRQLLATEERRQQVQRYVEAYARVPESAGEVRAARALAVRVLAALPWDEA